MTEPIHSGRKRVAFLVTEGFEQVGLTKPIAIICDGPRVLIEADVARGRTVTSWPSLRTESQLDPGAGECRAEEIAARTVNKERARSGESRERSRMNKDQLQRALDRRK